jgi:hypothetical protein
MYRCPRCEAETVGWADRPAERDPHGFWRIERTIRCRACGLEETGQAFTRRYHELIRRWRTA